MRTVTKTYVGAELALLLWVCQMHLMKGDILALLRIRGNTIDAVTVCQILAKTIGRVLPLA